MPDYIAVRTDLSPQGDAVRGNPARFALEAVDRNLPTLTGWVTEAPTPSGGVGGWDVVPRPGRRPLTPWRGVQDGYRITLAILFDRFAESRDGESVEDKCRLLERLGGQEGGDPRAPLLKASGAFPHASSVPGEKARWVVDAIEWGDAIYRPDGHRVRQAATLTLLRYEDDDHLERIKPRRGRPKFRTINARKGDTFEKVARRELGTARLGGRLARLNGNRSPDVKLAKGRDVKVPTGDELDTWKRDLRRGR